MLALGMFEIKAIRGSTWACRDCFGNNDRAELLSNERVFKKSGDVTFRVSLEL